VTAVLRTGHVFSQWTDGVRANLRTDTNVTANLTVTAAFAAVRDVDVNRADPKPPSGRSQRVKARRAIRSSSRVQLTPSWPSAGPCCRVRAPGLDHLETQWLQAGAANPAFGTWSMRALPTVPSGGLTPVRLSDTTAHHRPEV
jgi:hypothetical protein